MRRATHIYTHPVSVTSDFYPRSPCGERRTKKLRIPVPAYFYPRSPCGERLYDTYAKVLRVNISIHALLAESDLGNVAVGLPISNFYPRSPCGERRFSSGAKADTVSFLSTLSLRRATPRPPKKHQWPDISIHALLAESDSIIVLIIRHVHAFLSTLSLRRATRYGRPIDVQLVFLSTLSLRRATVPHVYIPGHRWISIHALLAESDSCPPARPFHCHDFYPRSPCGERHA